jgi:taurine dioxygenase
MKFLSFVAAALSVHCLAYELRVLNPHEHPQFGAEILGLDLETIDDKSFDAVHDALLRYKVLVVRNQKDLSVEGQRNFTKRFGHLHVHLESSSHLPGYQDVNVVSNIKNSSTGKYIGLYGAHVENFHSDLSW